MAGLIEVALGRRPAEVLIKNARVINVYTLELERADIAIWHGWIAGIGRYNQAEAERVIDARGLYAAPRFIDAHIHIESTFLTPGEFARAVVPRGTGAVIADPHEIANVCGLEGLKFMLENSQDLPLDVFYMVPSCVPASAYEASGAQLGLEEVREALGWEGILGLGEMMNYPGVLGQDPEVLAKLRAASDQGKPIDGHAPSLAGKELNAYLAAGPASDHETVAREEAWEKLRRGMVIQIREGSSEHNLRELVPLVNERNAHRFTFASDDRSPRDLLRQGHLDHTLRLAVAAGLDPLLAVQLATLNPAQFYGLNDRGALAPGKRADIVLLRDLEGFEAELVLHRGQVVAERGRPLFTPRLRAADTVRRTVNLKLNPEDLRTGAEYAAKLVIKLIPGQILTERGTESPRIVNGEALADPERDVLKLVLVERHRASGRVGKGFVQGFGLKRGALASSVAHDAHNLIAVGVSDADIFRAIRRVAELDGGLVVVADEEVLAELPLPLAGLHSDRPAAEVAGALERVLEATHELGSLLEDPFAALSFLALSVIPQLRLTVDGLLDVHRWELI